MPKGEILPPLSASSLGVTNTPPGGSSGLAPRCGLGTQRSLVPLPISVSVFFTPSRRHFHAAGHVPPTSAAICAFVLLGGGTSGKMAEKGSCLSQCLRDAEESLGQGLRLPTALPVPDSGPRFPPEPHTSPATDLLFLFKSTRVF